MSNSNKSLTRDEIATLYRNKMSALYNQPKMLVSEHHYIFADNVLARNAPALKWIVNGLNGAAKQAFEEATSIKLQKTQQKSWQQICVWGDYSAEQQEIDDLLGHLEKEIQTLSNKYSHESIRAFLSNAIKTIQDGFNHLEKIDGTLWLLKPHANRGINLSQKGVAEQQPIYKILLSLDAAKFNIQNLLPKQ